jgi:L-methionine (R)-S-oxide reductase
VNDASLALLGQKTGDEPYRNLESAAAALFEGERDFIANMANFSALLYHSLPDVNWCGFYLLKGEELVLGPFQGKIACVRIPLGRGVCGTSAQERRTVVVGDVDEFPGHIACDPSSRSEVVVPLIREGHLLGVLDIDSPVLKRFDQADALGLQRLVETLLASSDEK